MTDKPHKKYWIVRFAQHGHGIITARLRAIHKTYKSGRVVFETGGQQYNVNRDGTLSAAGAGRWGGENIYPDTPETRDMVKKGVMEFRAIRVQRFVGEHFDSRNWLKASPDQLARIVAIINEGKYESES